MAKVHGIEGDANEDQERTTHGGLAGIPATSENAKTAAEVFMDKWERNPNDLMSLRCASILYDVALEKCTEEGRAKLLFDAAYVSFQLWEKDSSDHKEKTTSQLFAQALEAYGQEISGYQLQMAAGFHLNVFRKNQTKADNLKEGTRLMLKGITVLGDKTSPASLLIGAIYHFRLWKFDQAQTDILNTTIDLYNRAVLAFGDDPHPKLLVLKQRIRDTCGCDVF